MECSNPQPCPFCRILLYVPSLFLSCICAAHSGPHFLCRLVGKGHCCNLFRGNLPFFKKMVQSGNQCFCLSRTRSGNNCHCAAPLLHRHLLLFIQTPGIRPVLCLTAAFCLLYGLLLPGVFHPLNSFRLPPVLPRFAGSRSIIPKNRFPG